MDFSIVKDEVEVHVAVIDPDAVVAFSHGVGCDLRVMLDHVVLDQDHFQRIQLGMDSDIRHS